MVLIVDSDVVYLVMSNARNRISGYFQINNDSNWVLHSKLNRAILIKCKALYHIVSSVAEVETTGIFHNAQIVILIWYVLE